ncbi:MAG: DUF305 domain-containing protein, partial [Longimicrobiales bacterium]
MSASGRGLLIAALLAPVALAACGGARTAGPPPAAGPANMSAAEIEALFRARKDSARAQFTEADVRFMTGMIHHHAQAIEMSQMAPTHGASSSIRTLAARIINAQRDEINRMQRWLGDRGLTVPEVEINPEGVMVHGADHAMHMPGMLMPGMLTPEQMRELDAASGTSFDRLFLTFMIQHHEGAVTMVHELFATDGAAQGDLVFKLASDVQ